MTTIAVCCTCKIRRLLYRRGCCFRDYNVHTTAVHRGDTTWQALEAAGLIAPAKKGTCQMPPRRRSRA